MIDFYATVSAGKERPKWMPVDVAYMCPASSWYRLKFKKPRLPEGVSVAADCGGFVATKIWGNYRYTPAQYIDWLHTFNPAWAATMDFCCEDEITSGNRGIVRKRQHLTTGMAQMFWRFHRQAAWTWVPTIQGWHVEDYVWHARHMKTLIEDMAARYNGDRRWRVGIGTLCNRASADMVQRVVRAVSDELPGVPLHLWGVKLNVLKSDYHLPNVVSVDSAAWACGGMLGVGNDVLREQRAMGMSQQQHEWLIQLPRYLDKVRTATNSPKQKILI